MTPRGPRCNLRRRPDRPLPQPVTVGARDEDPGVNSNESYGVGVRVIAMAPGIAHSDVTPTASRGSRGGVAIAKANARPTEPVASRRNAVSARSRGHPPRKNAFRYPRREGDLLLAAADAALRAAPTSSTLRFPGQRTEYSPRPMDLHRQDVHRIFPTSLRPRSTQLGKFETRNSLSSPVGIGWEYRSGRADGKARGPAGTLRSLL